ncbi:CapA family protein [Halobacillus yeomjeoni]|uniref:CapA family protein n=1 Tax=Halobacillus yeomjeoni TaxID=311194 RepID=UPI001CD67E86|nr:CapA family protein [Halobacillus yeomjeoni]MCA0984795.1 CapA family protein [Halobacillus yeomjeoni]
MFEINRQKLTLIGFFIIFFISGCDLSITDHAKDPGKLHASSSVNVKDKKQRHFNKEITISAIGDILIHSRVYRDAKTEDGYEFFPMMDEVQSQLSSSTITIANQETMIGGVELGLSGYPQFNSPTSIGDTLKELGVDVVTLANNHTLDRGLEAIDRSIKYWDKIGMKHTGAYTNKEASEKILTYHTEEGISVAILSYTYGTNGIPSPDGKNYVVNRINYQKMASDIEKAKKQADSVLLNLHAGKEYQPYPSDYQKQLARFGADHGVDAVIGHHPHVLQPLEWVEGKNGNNTLVIYSLGNFFSGQNPFQTRIGGILTFSLKTTNDDADPIVAANPTFEITFVKSDGEHRYEVVPMHKISRLSQEYENKKKHLSQWMPDLQFVE